MGKAKAPAVVAAASEVMVGDLAAAPSATCDEAIEVAVATSEAVVMGARETAAHGNDGASQATVTSKTTGVRHSRGDTTSASEKAPRPSESTGTTYASHVVVVQHVGGDDMRTHNMCARKSRSLYCRSPEQQGACEEATSEVEEASRH